MLFQGLVLLLLWTAVQADVIVYDKGEELVDQYNDLPARFGPLFPLDGLHAYPVMASDVYGCATLKPPPIDREAPANFVVLMARNNCTFFEKVINAEKAGYAAAIVYNIDSDDLVEMSGDSGSTEDATIPAMFLGYYSAMEIKNLYVYDAVMKNYMVVLNRNLPFNINTHLLWPFVAIVVLTFLTMIFVTIVKCLRHRNRVQRQRLPQRDLRRLPVIRYNKDTCRYETCAICLDEYIEGERLRVLPCQHTYHTKCVDPWLTRGKRNCPMCKQKVRLHPRSRARRTSSESDSSSGSSTADTRPLLPARNANNGTFPVPEVEQATERRGFMGFFQNLFGGPRVREEEPVTTATVSAVVDMSPDPIPDPEGSLAPPPPAVFQSPSQVVVPITTPISSPLRSAAIAQVRSRSVESSDRSRSNRDTPRIGVAALPNVNFQGFGGGGFLPQIPPVVAQPPPPPPQARQQAANSSVRSNSRHSRRRRRGGHHEEV